MIKLLFILLPFAYISFGTIYRGQQTFFVIAGFALTVEFIKNKAIQYFFYYVILSVLWVMVHNMLLSNPNINSGPAFSMIIYGWGAAAVILAASKSNGKFELFFHLICAAALLQTLIAIGQHLGFDPYEWFLSNFFKMAKGLDPDIMTGTLGNPNYLAGFLAISLPFFLRKYWAWCIPLLCVVFYVAETSTAVIAAATGVLVYYRHFRKEIHYKDYTLPINIYWITVPLAAVVAVYVLTDNHYNPIYQDVRWEWWGNITVQTLNTWKTTLFGFGPGAYWGKPYPMHNEWVTLFHQLGAVGVIMVLLYIIHIPIPGKIDSREYRMLFAALIAAMVECFGNHAFHLAPSAFLILMIIGLIERKVNG